MALVNADFRAAIMLDIVAQANSVAKEMKAQALLQGHRATGRMENSIEVIKVSSSEVHVLVIDYARDLNDGVPASRVRAIMSTKSERIKFINDLTKWYQQRTRGSLRNARSVAIAIAKKASLTGFPTPGAKRFSKNGKRLGFIDDAVKQAGELNNFPSFERIITTLPNV